MSTNDVPGAVAANRDELGAGCWAEAEDGCLLYVYSTEGGKVFFDMYDTTVNPITDYRDAMTENDFKSAFSYDPKKFDTKDSNGRQVPMAKWTWHDKTPFPMSRVMKAGFREGYRDPSAVETISRADRIRESIDRTQGSDQQTSTVRRIADALRLAGQAVDENALKDSLPTERGGDILGRFKRAAHAFIDELGK